MRIFLFYLISFLFCQSGYGQNLKMELFNKTGYDLDSVSIGEKYVGFIKSGHSLLISDCKEITMQDGLPYGLPDGTIKNKKRNTELLGLCGTGRTSVSSGNFKFNITVMENEFGYRLFWDYHK